MADLGRMKKSRSAHKNVLQGLIIKAQNFMKEGPGEEALEEVNAVLRTITKKVAVITELDGKILEEIDEADIEKDVEEATVFEMKIEKDIAEIEGYIKKKFRSEPKDDVAKTGFRSDKTGVKLPKIIIKKFSGDPILWQQFEETFEATVDKNSGLSDIEKFSYLKGYLTGSAEKCIEGLTLTSENYREAVTLLKERFGNPQMVIASHMQNLLKIEKVGSGRGGKDLRSLYDQVESHVRALHTAGVDSDHYGALLIPIIMERLPDDIKLEISRKLGTKRWQIDAFLAILKGEIAARENCDYLKSQTRSDKHGSTEKPDRGEGSHFTTEALHTGARILVCAFCGGNHYHDKCSVVTEMAERKRIVSEKNLCYRCLFSGHVLRECKSRKNCFRCKGRNHHTAICKKDPRNKEETEEKKKDEKEESMATLVNSRTSVLLQTACGIISDTAEKVSHPIKILLDPGSQRTYLSERIVRKLNLQPFSKREMTVKAFGDVRGKSNVFNEYRFCVKNPKRGCNLYLTGYAVPHICSPLSEQKLEVVEKLYPILKKLDLSDVSRGDGDIDLLLGADYYWNVVEGGIQKCGPDGLTAINTKLGWVLNGPYKNKSVHRNPVAARKQKEEVYSLNTTATNLIEVSDVVKLAVEGVTLSEQVEKLWNLETLGIMDNETSWVERCLDSIEMVNGRYEVNLPFKERRKFIEDNYNLSERRLTNLKKKLDKDPKLLQEYDDIMKNQIEEGIIEKVVTDPVVGEVTYLPHQPVIRDDKKTTRLRIVFDCSAKGKGSSLNEGLYKGPLLTPLLFDVLLRFRVGRIGLTADIAKAYLQISVKPSDRDYMRLLWYDDVTEQNPESVKYRFTRVIFGASSSQFLLNSIIRLHAEQYNKVDPGFSSKVSRIFYVDDLTCSEGSYEEGLQLYKKVKIRFFDANLNVRKWRTNDEKLRQAINDQESEISSVEVGDKVLGIPWDENLDNLVMDFQSCVTEADNIVLTKRNVLKVTASIYDPLGFIQPLIVTLKLLYQKICVCGKGWDDVLDDDVKKEFYDVMNEIRSLGQLIIPRCYHTVDFNDPVERVELHGFSDGSTVAYGGCVYLKFVTKAGDIKVSFVAAKSRVVPSSKKLTVPRVELLGNFILSRLAANVLRALESQLIVNKVFCWSDSQISLAWIKGVNKEFKTFVENRIVEIRRNLDVTNWYYCRTEVNPADLITREGNSMKSTMWLNGPEFLYNPTIPWEYELNGDVATEHDFTKEIRNDESNLVLLATQKESILIGSIIDIQKYNDYLKLIRVTGYVLRFVNNLKKKRSKQSLEMNKYLTTPEINEARRLWIIDNQNQLSSDEKYNDLCRNLNLKEGEDGLIRSYSRLKNAKIPFDTKAPVLINKSHKLAEILVNYSHLKVLHRGIKQTLTELRARYWITRGRSFVKKLLNPCTVCKKLNARPYEYPNHSDLPELRFDDTNPFASTGVDYLGPLLCLPVYGKAESLHKAYIVLYTCTSTRAVILEVVNNANTDTFLNSFRRFLSRRGCPSTMVSDNGGVFTADETQKYAAEHQITWKFSLDCAPWFGGVWERLVASVKRCIKKVVGTKKLTYVELQTLVSEIELILNNRPIGVDYDDDEEDVLTPNHLIFGRRLETCNDVGDVTLNDSPPKNSKLAKRKRMLDIMLSHFWERWRKEYVTSLREAQRIPKQKQSAKIAVSDVVIIYDEKQPRHLWKVAKVTKLIPGRDGRVRGAEVKVGKSGFVIRRPVNRLYPLLKAEI